MHQDWYTCVCQNPLDTLKPSSLQIPSTDQLAAITGTSMLYAKAAILRTKLLVNPPSVQILFITQFSEDMR